MAPAERGLRRWADALALIGAREGVDEFCDREIVHDPGPRLETLGGKARWRRESWYELGAVGALLLAIAGAAVALLIFLLPVSTQPFAAGAFAAFAIVGAFAWGMWQSSFMCTVALLPIYLRISALCPESS